MNPRELNPGLDSGPIQPSSAPPSPHPGYPRFPGMEGRSSPLLSQLVTSLSQKSSPSANVTYTLVPMQRVQVFTYLSLDGESFALRKQLSSA